MKVKDIRALRCDEYVEEHEICELIEGLYEGNEEWREHIAHWLPASKVEPADLLKERHARATYEPILPVVVNLTVGAILAEPPVVEGLADDIAKRIDQDCDGARTSLASFCAHQLKHMLLYRRAWTWIEVPRAEVAEISEADSRGRLAKVYLRIIEPECVIAWSFDRGNLSGVLLEEEVTERPDIAAPPTRKVRWTAVDAQRIRAWEWTPKWPDQKEPEDEDDVAFVQDVAHGYGFMPIRVCELDSDKTLGWRLLDPCTAHVRASCELDWALFRSATELLVITSSSEVPTPKTGAGYWLNLRRDSGSGGGRDSAEYVGPSGVSLDKLIQRERDARTAVYRAAQHIQMAADPTSAAARQSADSKARDAEPTAILLDTYGDTLRDYVLEIMRGVATLTRTNPDAVKVTGFQGKERTDAGATLKAHAMAGDLFAASPTAHALALRTQVAALFPDLDAATAQKINDEIEAAALLVMPGTGDPGAGPAPAPDPAKTDQPPGA